ncbi:MAG: NAD(P)/FAD-dependent oxidoreductase [Treponema sp.]|nr:NAD(P)/FAD-dependent oxidoreductase [Treponema sp.]MCL2272667.1 NAD(P)/FAD-dependent oxidoreductase [Treponema sp.]
MSSIRKLNKKLEKAFGGKVRAELKGGVLCLSGRLSEWNDVVCAGLMSVNKKKYTVVNDIEWTGTIPPMRMPFVKDNALDGSSPDVLVIGGGITGCAIARELTRYKINVMLVDKEHDVALHASSRNDGMIHPGIDLLKGQLKKKYNDEGNRLYPSICEELDVPYRFTGQYLCFTDSFMKPFAVLSLAYWKFMGIPAKYISRKEILKKEPYLNEKVKCALFFPSSGVVCPYGLTIAYAENAADNGAKISLDTAVTGMKVEGGEIKSVSTNRGVIFPKLVINAAGVFAEDVARFAQDRFFSIHPRRGTNIILDKKVSYNVETIASLLQISERRSSRKEHSKGGGTIHTVSGNLLVGPNAIETHEKENFSVDQESIKRVLSKQQKTAPGLSDRDIITYFTGIRAASYEEDFIVSSGKFTKNIIHAAGIQSPGITAAPAIASDISKMAAEKLGSGFNEKFNPHRKGIVRAAELTDHERDALIKNEPDYGNIVCRCEEVSRGEVLAALRRSVPCDTMDGVKRRVRPGMGRCQGSFCGPQILQIIAEEKKMPLTEVRKMSYDSRILLGGNKDDL